MYQLSRNTRSLSHLEPKGPVQASKVITFFICYFLNGRIDGAQSQSGGFGKRKNFFTSRESEVLLFIRSGCTRHYTDWAI